MPEARYVRNLSNRHSHGGCRRGLRNLHSLIGLRGIILDLKPSDEILIVLDWSFGPLAIVYRVSLTVMIAPEGRPVTISEVFRKLSLDGFLIHLQNDNAEHNVHQTRAIAF